MTFKEAFCRRGELHKWTDHTLVFWFCPTLVLLSSGPPPLYSCSFSLFPHAVTYAPSHDFPLHQPIHALLPHQTKPPWQQCGGQLQQRYVDPPSEEMALHQRRMTEGCLEELITHSYPHTLKRCLHRRHAWLIPKGCIMPSKCYIYFLKWIALLQLMPGGCVENDFLMNLTIPSNWNMP